MKLLEKLAARQKCNFDSSGVSIAFLGDSVTQGCFEQYRLSAEEIGTVFDQEHAFHHRLAKMLATLYPCVPINVINAGISGSCAPHGLSRLERDVLRHKPDLVVVCFGLNDATQGLESIDTYLDSLRGIFTRLQESEIETIFMTPNMMATYVPYQMTDSMLREVSELLCEIQNGGILTAYLDAAKALCPEYGVQVCDCYGKWQKLYRSGVDITSLVTINHPVREMHNLFAVSLLETLFAD